jgi:hypothetical protein
MTSRKASRVLVDRAARVPGGICDLVQGRAFEPPGGEDLLGRVEEEVPGVLAAPVLGPPFNHRHSVQLSDGLDT